MHAWESIQKTLEYIEDNIIDDISVNTLADIAALSVFYFQRLFTRLVHKPVREYIKLRRLAHAAEILRSNDTYIIDIAVNLGFGGRETFSRAFKEVYGFSPAEYRANPIGLNYFDKPNLLLNYVMVDEGVPLVTEGIVLEYNRRILDKPIHFLGVQDLWQFVPGKMLGERPGVSKPAEIWDRFFAVKDKIPHDPNARHVGVSFHGGAPDGYSTYFVGVEVDAAENSNHFANWQLPARPYIVCGYEAENFAELISSLGKMMKFTRFWLKDHGLRADGFFPEIYYNNQTFSHAYMEMWIPFTER
ncbi:MAG: AraC family transcriptional regulator [Defluviitaleaceae bacterium]|nr:AraC family transcriptional regulator [Defluviitaleaceae bacterium]